MTIPHTGPRERTVTPAELADHAARTERARAGAQLPRTLRALTEQGARLVQCTSCWQRPGLRCSRFYPPGDHLARFVTAEKRGLITRAELAALIEGLDVIAGCVLIPDVTP
jgi:hypothetical protein